MMKLKLISNLKILNKIHPTIDTDMRETYILGDFNMNKYEIDKYIVYENC